MDATELQDARASVDSLIAEASQFQHRPIPVEPEARKQYGFAVANLRERLQGAGMSAFVLDENGYRLDEINKVLGTLDSVSRHLDASRPQLSDDTAPLPAAGESSPGALEL